jgi:hypothetical protein
MAAWQRTNEAAGMDGRMHLDLLLTSKAGTSAASS